MPPLVSSLLNLLGTSVVRDTWKPPEDLPLKRLFDVRNDERASFKTDTHKIRYLHEPGIGASAFVARRNHPGSGTNRLWRRIRHVCSPSASKLRQRSSKEIHLSVAPGDMKKAYERISFLLTRDRCPFDDFKVLNPVGMDTGNRADAGARITLYVHRHTDLRMAGAYMLALGERLVEAGVGVGSTPPGDVQFTDCPSLAFFSCRNEDLSTLDGDSPPFLAMKDYYGSVCDLAHND